MYRRSFPLINFTKQIVIISVIFWVHDFPNIQVLSCIGLLLAYIVTMGVSRPFKLKKEHFKHFFFELPISMAYSFILFGIQKDFSPVRFFQVNTAFYISGIGTVLSLMAVYLYVNSILFFYTFTGLWEWANKITERCRGDTKPFQVMINLFIYFRLSKNLKRKKGKLKLSKNQKHQRKKSLLHHHQNLRNLQPHLRKK